MARAHTDGLLGVPLLAAIVAMTASWQLHAAAESRGRVAQVAVDGIYLDAGRDHGLVLGARVGFLRDGRASGECEVQLLADHRALCTTSLPPPAVGDVFVFTSRGASAREAVPERPERERLQLDVDAARAEVASSRWQLVAFQGPRAQPSMTVRGHLRSSNRSHMAIGSASSWERAALDVGVAAPLGRSGLRYSLAARLEGDLQDPSGERFRPDDPMMVYLWDGNLTWRATDSPLVATVGRFRLAAAPGVTLLDGLHAGYAPKSGAYEVGGFAGLVPDVTTVAPSLERMAVGAYTSADVGNDEVRVLPRLRLQWTSPTDWSSWSAQAEGMATLAFRNDLSAGAGARVGYGSDATVSLEAAHLDADWRPSLGWSTWAAWRYWGSPANDLDARRDLAPVLAAHHGSFGLRAPALPWLILGASSGVFMTGDGQNARGFLGPEAWFPNDHGEVHVGFLEELGGISGRQLWVSSRTSLPGPTRLFLRAAYFDTAIEETVAREAALSTSLEISPLRNLRLAVRSHAQMGIPIISSQPVGLVPVLTFDLVGEGTW